VTRRSLTAPARRLGLPGSTSTRGSSAATVDGNSTGAVYFYYGGAAGYFAELKGVVDKDFEGLTFTKHAKKARRRLGAAVRKPCAPGTTGGRGSRQWSGSATRTRSPRDATVGGRRSAVGGTLGDIARSMGAKCCQGPTKTPQRGATTAHRPSMYSPTKARVPSLRAELGNSAGVPDKGGSPVVERPSEEDDALVRRNPLGRRPEGRARQVGGHGSKCS
jgi:hypothetical protein